MYPKLGISVAAGLLLVGVLTVSDRPNRDETASAGESASLGDTTAGLADTTPSPTAAADLSDANIVALLDHANAADSSAGALAAKKATNPKVKKFAQMMMSDHHQLRKQGQDLAKKLGVAPEPPANDPVTLLEKQETEALQAAEKGADSAGRHSQKPSSAHRSPPRGAARSNMIQRPSGDQSG